MPDIAHEDIAHDIAHELIKAAMYGNIKTVRSLLKEQNVNPNIISRDIKSGGITALIAASGVGHTKIVKLLLAQQSINVNATANGGVTALMAASLRGNTEIVKLLLEQGADVHHKTVQDNILDLEQGADVHNKTVQDNILDITLSIDDRAYNNTYSIIAVIAVHLYCTDTEHAQQEIDKVIQSSQKTTKDKLSEYIKSNEQECLEQIHTFTEQEFKNLSMELPLRLSTLHTLTDIPATLTKVNWLYRSYNVVQPIITSYTYYQDNSLLDDKNSSLHNSVLEKAILGGIKQALKDKPQSITDGATAAQLDPVQQKK